MSDTATHRDPELTLTDLQGQVLNPAIEVYLPDTLSADQFRLLLPEPPSKPAFTFPALQNWLTNLLKNFDLQHNEQHPCHKHPFRLHEINVQAVDWFSSTKIGFMKIRAKIETDAYLHESDQAVRADWLPGAVFLRGGSVAMLILVQPEDAQDDAEKHVIFTVQPRIAASSLAFSEIPAGMLDGNTFKGAAAAELEEEARLIVKEDDLINMSELALDGTPSTSSLTATSEEGLQSAMYPSPGACDEFIPLFLCQKRLTRRHMEWLKGKATGLRDEGENITLKLVPLERAWSEGARDAKALAALALYHGLKGEGRLPSMSEEVEGEPEDLAGDAA